MIVERLTFQARYGHGDELVALFKDFLATQAGALGMSGGRVYTDVTGEMFTLQLETEFADLGAYAAFMARDQEHFATQAFQEWFAKTVPLTDGGSRQLLNVEHVGV
ncbi:MAG: hypothetical protein U0547_13680 [Dehalococcoidia bacterium]